MEYLFNKTIGLLSKYIPRRIPEHPDTKVQNLSATTSGGHSVNLSWEKPKSENVQHYEIEYREQTDPKWGSPATVESDVFQYNVENLTENVPYEFRVRAIFKGNKSGLHSEIIHRVELSPENKDNSRQVQLARHSVTKDTMKQLQPKNQLGRKDNTQKQSNKPGQPRATEIQSNSVSLAWNKPACDKNIDHYEVKIKSTNESNWPRTSILTSGKQLHIFVTNLSQNTEYEFKVRQVLQDDTVGDFSEISDPILTKQSPTVGILSLCQKTRDGNPSIYKVPWLDIAGSRNTIRKTRKLEFGKPASQHHTPEKTIMMIGATGAGKSTLIDGMINYLLGVKWEDAFRFKAIHLMPDEEKRQGRQDESQTEWITNYTLYPMNKTIQYNINVIDTPGLGDTRGIERDQELMKQIESFFSEEGIKGIETLDAVCFVVQASSARLTPSQKYIFSSILSIFGKDIAKNIVLMITFADGNDPQVLSALKSAEVPFERHFLFNNRALYQPQDDDEKTFWKRTSRNYEDFFKFLPTLTTQSLQLTAEVLKKREILSTTVQGIMRLIDACLEDLSAIKLEKEQLEKCQRDIEGCEDFKYTTTETHPEHIALSPGEYVTNCKFCHFTCHYRCYIPLSADKYGCAAMCNGYCTACVNNCQWDLHESDDFRIEFQTITIEKTLEDMKAKYDFATEEKASKEDILKAMKSKYSAKFNELRSMLAKARDHGNYLRENAIQANPLSEVEYLDLLIANELHEKKHGFQNRVDVLNKLKRKAEISASATATNESSQDDLLQQLGFDDV